MPFEQQIQAVLPLELLVSRRLGMDDPVIAAMVTRLPNGGAFELMLHRPTATPAATPATDAAAKSANEHQRHDHNRNYAPDRSYMPHMVLLL